MTMNILNKMKICMNWNSFYIIIKYIKNLYIDLKLTIVIVIFRIKISWPQRLNIGAKTI